MPITKASSSAVAPAAKGDLVVGSATNDSGVLAVGSTDQVLTVDSSTATGLKWATASAGGMTLLSTTTLSGASTTISSINQTYKDLKIVIKNMDTNNVDSYLAVRMNADTGTRHRTTTSFGTVNDQTFNDTQWEIMYPVDEVVTSNIGVIYIYDYTNTTTFKLANIVSVGNNTTTTTNINVKTATGIYNQLSAITSIECVSVLGSFVGGTVLIYGVS